MKNWPPPFLRTMRSATTCHHFPLKRREKERASKRKRKPLQEKVLYQFKLFPFASHSLPCPPLTRNRSFRLSFLFSFGSKFSILCIGKKKDKNSNLHSSTEVGLLKAGTSNPICTDKGEDSYATMDCLPVEILIEIISHLDAQEVVIFSQVSLPFPALYLFSLNSFLIWTRDA